MNQTGRYGHLKSFLEVPILNPKYWAKVPQVAVDAIMMDLEDSVNADSKSLARERVVAALSDPAFFAGREMVVRVNNLATDWGHEDLAMLAGNDANVLVCYPKAETAEEIAQIVARIRQGRADRGLWAMIESARGILNIAEIAKVEGVVGLHFGYTDYAADMGVSPFNADGGLLGAATTHACHQVAIAATANGQFSTGGSMIPDFRNEAKVECFLRGWREFGFTGCLALSPSHLPLIERVFVPSAEEAATARELCVLFEKAIADGAANVQVDGRVITLPDYRRALKLLSRCRET